MLRNTEQVQVVSYRDPDVRSYFDPFANLPYILDRQNNVTELYSLLKFLRIKPLSNWDTFNTQIAKPVTSGRGAGRAMKRLQVYLSPLVTLQTLTL